MKHLDTFLNLYGIFYCDWYLEYLKPIFNSKNKNDVEEAKNFSSFMLANILKILHPFIPFFTETLWKKKSNILDLYL